jgi:hypothetical protein
MSHAHASTSAAAALPSSALSMSAAVGGAPSLLRDSVALLACSQNARRCAVGTSWHARESRSNDHVVTKRTCVMAKYVDQIWLAAIWLAAISLSDERPS